MVHGRVQGVGFRDFVRRSARGLGLAGWVRNRADGCVEAEALGDEASLARFALALAAGPPSSRVSQVERLDLTESGWQGSGFEIVR